MAVIKPSSGNMTTGNEMVVGSEIFFNMMNFESRKFKTERVVFKVSKDAHNIMIKLQESGLIRASKLEIYRGLIAAGIISMANKKAICKSKIKTIRKTCKSSRVAGNIKKLETVMKYLERSERTEKMLKTNIKKHGNNIYGVRLNEYVGEWGLPNSGSSKVVVQPNIERTCKNWIEDNENANLFFITRQKNVENPKLDIKIPMVLTIIAFKLKEEYETPKTFSEVYRAAFSTGLNILCDWIVKNEIPEEEYNFCKILHNLYDFVTDDCA
jgi:hypothetical protein